MSAHGRKRSPKAFLLARRAKGVGRTIGVVGLLVALGASFLIPPRHAQPIRVAYQPPPAEWPADAQPAPTPGPDPAERAPFSVVRTFPGDHILGFGGPISGLRSSPQALVSSAHVTNGRVSQLTLQFPVATRFYDALTVLTRYLPGDARVVFNQLQQKSCRQVEYRSPILTRDLEVPAVLVELTSLPVASKHAHAGLPPFRYDSVAAARFTSAPLGDRGLPC